MTIAAPDRSAVRTRSLMPGADGRPVLLRARSRERGIVLIWAAATMLIVAGVLIQGTRRLKAIDEMAGAEFSAEGQAKQVAEAGLVDAHAWFRRQQVQPVTTFLPRLDLAAVPPINETDNPAEGLVRTFEISPGLWGRYTVQAGGTPETFVDANANGVYDAGEVFTDTDADGKRGHGTDSRDVTAARGLPGAGAVWHLESRAQIFRRQRADQPLGTGMNLQLATATLAAEVRRLGMVPPASAAICSSALSGIDLGVRTRVRSPGTCIAYGSSGGGLPLLTGSELLGTVSTALVPGWNDTVDAVFGVDWTVLQGMADISTTDVVAGVPSPLPDASLVVVTGDIDFTLDRPLKGTAVLVVKGNVTISGGSNSFFSGMLYVDGNLTVRAPALLRGTILVRGTTDMRGTGGDYVEVEHDAPSLTRLMTLMGQYRYSKVPYRPALVGVDGRPDEAKGMKIRLKKN